MRQKCVMSPQIIYVHHRNFNIRHTIHHFNYTTQICTTRFSTRGDVRAEDTSAQYEEPRITSRRINTSPRMRKWLSDEVSPTPKLDGPLKCQYGMLIK